MYKKILLEIISLIFKLAFIVALAFVLVKASKWSYNEGYNILASNNSGAIKTVSVTIPKGASTEQIANILEDAGLINSTFFFRMMSKINGVENKYQYGDYTFSTSKSQDEIMKTLTTEGAKKDVRKFTLVEGLTLEQTAKSLAEQGVCSVSDFYEALDEHWNYAFLDSIPSDRKIKYQGYILPDTYEVYADATAKEVLGVIFNEMNKLWTDERIAQAESRGLTVDEVLTIASIIEREVKEKSEQPLVASVIYNRLEQNMPLQMCSTIMYALKVPREKLYDVDLQVESPYNTYKNIGLPVGPIANPGKDAIIAALEPDNTDYLYFVLKDDDSGTHNFNETLEGHNVDKEKYQGTFNF